MIWVIFRLPEFLKESGRFGRRGPPRMAVVKVFVCWDNRPEMRRSCWVSLGGIRDWIGGEIACLIYKPTQKSCWGPFLTLHPPWFLFEKTSFKNIKVPSKVQVKGCFRPFFAHFSAAGSENTVLADHLHTTEAHLAMLEWWGLLPRWRVWDCRKNI